MQMSRHISGWLDAMRVKSRKPPAAYENSRFASLWRATWATSARSEEHTSELQSHVKLVCRLLLEKKKRFSNASGRWTDRLAQTHELHAVRSPLTAPRSEEHTSELQSPVHLVRRLFLVK